MDPPKGGQPLYSGQIALFPGAPGNEAKQTDHLPLIDFTIELIHFEPLRSGHLSTPNNGH